MDGVQSTWPLRFASLRFAQFRPSCVGMFGRRHAGPVPGWPVPRTLQGENHERWIAARRTWRWTRAEGAARTNEWRNWTVVLVVGRDTGGLETAVQRFGESPSVAACDPVAVTALPYPVDAGWFVTRKIAGTSSCCASFRNPKRMLFQRALHVTDDYSTP